MFMQMSFKCGPSCPVGDKTSDNGLAPIKREAITWPIAGPIKWRIYGSPGLTVYFAGLTTMWA